MQTHPGWFLPVLLCYMFSISPYKLTVKNKNKQPTESTQRGQNLLPVVSWILFCFFGFPQNVFLDELKGCWWKSTTSSGECRELYLEEWAPRTGRYWPGPPHPFSASLVVSDGKESACSAGDLGLIPRLGRSPGEENGYPLQQSCLEKIMDRGAWQATGLQSLGLQRVGHDGATSVCTRTHTHTQILSSYLYLWPSAKTGY